MTTIKAPFNFVPLSDKVFFPDWSGDISHDIPFKDGVSGTIELKITAESPIFVRNGHTKQDAEEKNKTYKDFSNINGEYFIPATSVKGAIRSVLEVLSFGKMQFIANNRYSIRDLKLKKYMSHFQNTDIHCGWMKKEGEDKVIIRDCGIPRRLSHQDIDERLDTQFCKTFSQSLNEEKRTALYKYGLVKNKSLLHNFKELPLNPNNIVDKRLKVIFDPKGKEGVIVFTGQASPRQEKEVGHNGNVIRNASGKFYEFVFLNTTNKTFSLDCNDKEGAYQDFCFAHKDSKDWEYWREKMKKGEEVPVFFSLTDSGELLHFGLSYLYKLPYPKRIKNFLFDEHKKTNLDFCDCIFGTTQQKKLKGRVLFSHATSKSISDNKEINPYMGSPKPTYYPIYIRQEGENGYLVKNDKGIEFSTMLNGNAKLRGWKRYPIREEVVNPFNIPENQENNINPFFPMPPGSEFICKMRFHNLKKAELGGLVSALILPNGCSHSIGFAKAFGYGRVKMEILSISGMTREEMEDARNIFIETIKKEIPDYNTSPQIREFYAMSRPQELSINLEYMELKDFVHCKKQQFREKQFGEYLQDYSMLIKKAPAQTKIEKVEAYVSVLQGKLKQAKLKGEHNSIPLEVDKINVKLKVGDLIVVEKISKSGKVIKLIFKKKI